MELLFIRRHLDWHHSDIDRFIAALALGSLHGEMDKSSSYFSNQMPRTISTKPAYSIRYWREHGLRPKRRRVFEILRNRARLRLQDGRPSHPGIALQADVRKTSSSNRAARSKYALFGLAVGIYDVYTSQTSGIHGARESTLCIRNLCTNVNTDHQGEGLAQSRALFLDKRSIKGLCIW